MEIFNLIRHRFLSYRIPTSQNYAMNINNRRCGLTNTKGSTARAIISQSHVLKLRHRHRPDTGVEKSLPTLSIAAEDHVRNIRTTMQSLPQLPNQHMLQLTADISDIR
jgi:hypothetical protein